MEKIYTLSLVAKRDAFVILKEWLSNIAEEIALSVKVKKQVLIVADEIFTNIALYGYPKTEGDAKVVMTFDAVTAEMTLTFIDSGVAFNPLDAPEPDVTIPLAERPIGGLGMFMVKKMTDRITYERRDGQNILTLEFSLKNRT